MWLRIFAVISAMRAPRVITGRYSPQFGTLQAQWGYGALHDGEAYEVHLCETCFFGALASLQNLRRGELMFSDQGFEHNSDFGRVEIHTKELI
jgi:hypothetical protein